MTEAADPTEGRGPKIETPLSRYLWDAWQACGLGLDAIARKARLSLSTVGFYVNGERGGGGQRRTRDTIKKIANAMNADADTALRLAGLPAIDDLATYINKDDRLSRRQKRILQEIYREMRGDPPI